LRHQFAPARTQNRRRLPAEEVLSRTGPRGAVVLHGIDDTFDDRHRSRPRRRKRALGSKQRRRAGRGDAMKHITRKATRHISQNEGLIFEKSSPGKAAWRLPPLDVPEVDTAKLLGKQERKDLGDMPEVSEIEIIRHFTRLSTWNYAIDLGMYPLGSCTMKYNPRVNEFVARVEGL